MRRARPEVGSFIQLEAEVLQIAAVLNSGSRFQLVRGVHTSASAAHASGTLVYTLSNKTQIVPFARNFFGSPASGAWSFPIFLPDCRITSAELFVTNIKGNSPTAVICVTQADDYGLRTLAGGQYSFQVEGFLAIETGATPDIIVENKYSVRDVYAVIRQAPVGGPIHFQVNQNGTLVLRAHDRGWTNGFGLGGRRSTATVDAGREASSLDITMVGPTNPGADLTVVIRL